MVFGLYDLFKFSQTLRYIHDERGQRVDVSLDLASLVCIYILYCLYRFTYQIYNYKRTLSLNLFTAMNCRLAPSQSFVL